MAYGLGVINVLHEAHFTVFAADGVTPLTGQAGGVTSSLVKNGAGTAEVVTIAEIGVTGRYHASYTPLAQGTYDLRLTMPAVDGRVVGETMEVYDRDISDLTEIADVQTALTAQGYTTVRAGNLDYLDASVTGIYLAIDALNDISVADIFAHVVEAGFDFDEFLRIIISVLAGLSSGGGTATNTFRDLGDTKDRVSMTVDVNGNRTVVITRDGS